MFDASWESSRNRLEILENPDNPVPDQWYKDEGGRENCVELQVRAVAPGRSRSQLASRPCSCCLLRGAG